MKKKSFIKILVLLAVIVAVPIAIYILSANETYRSFLVPKILNNFSEKTIKTESLKKANLNGYESYKVFQNRYQSDVEDNGTSNIVLGTLEYSKLDKYDWHYPYTVRANTYCVDSYWPLIKVKDGEFGDPIVGSFYDILGTEDAYNADQEFSRLPNRNGHLVRIEYDTSGSYTSNGYSNGYKDDLYKGLTYLKWQNIATDFNIQRVVWSSWVWYVSQGYGRDYMGSNYVLENKDIRDNEAFETVKYYCGRDSYVPSDITPSVYDADSYYNYGGPVRNGKDGDYVEPRSGHYHDSQDRNGDGKVSVEEQLNGRSVEEWRRDIIAGLEATYGPLSRTIQFATFEYQIIKRNFPVVSLQDDIHAYVDQVNDQGEHRLPSYTFGPYKISMMDGGYNYGNELCSNRESGETLKLKELVYNEITGGNFGQKAGNTFLTSEFKVKVKYRNSGEKVIKTTIKPKYDDPEAFNDEVVHSYQNDSFVPGGVVLVDPEGNALEEGFPKFDEDFYIRYYVDDNENTLEKLVGSDISFTYMGDEMKVSGYRFKSSKLAYSIHYNLCKYYDRQEAQSGAFKELKSEYERFDYDLNEKAHKAWKEKQEGGEIYIYKQYTGGNDSANVKDAIKMLEDGIAKSSNRMVSPKDVTVSWEDDLWTDWDSNKVLNRYMHQEGGRSREQDRVDGIFLNGCDYLKEELELINPYPGIDPIPIRTPAVSGTGKAFFPEYNDIDTFYNNQEKDFWFVYNTYGMGSNQSGTGMGFRSLSPQSYDNGCHDDEWTINPNLSLEDAIYEQLGEWGNLGKYRESYILDLVEGGFIRSLDNRCGCQTCNCGDECTCGTCQCCTCSDCSDEDDGCDDCDRPCGCDCEGDPCGCYYHTLVFEKNIKFNFYCGYRRDIDPLGGDESNTDNFNCTLKSYRIGNGAQPWSITFNEPGVDNYIQISDYNKTDEEIKQEMIDTATRIIREKLRDKIVEFINQTRALLKDWIYHKNKPEHGAYAGLYIPYIMPDTNDEGCALPFVEEENTGFQPMIAEISGISGESWHTRDGELKLPGYEINMYLGGNVTEEKEGMKGDGYTNVVGSGGGIEVSLYNEDLKMFVALTTTDQNGNYGFQYVNPLHQYKVVFKYNGMQYLTETEYKRDMSDPGNQPGETGGRVNSVESGTGDPITEIEPTNTGQVFTSGDLDSYRRDEVNKRFTTIEAAENNDQSAYGSYTDKDNNPSKAYGWYTKIKNNNRQYVRNGTNGIGALLTSETETDAMDYNFGAENQGAVRYADVYNKFKEISTHPDISKDTLSPYLPLTETGRDVAYDGDYYYKAKIEELDGILGDLSEDRQVINYLENTFVTAVTNYYPYINKTRYWLETLDKTKDDHTPKDNYPTKNIKIDGELIIDLFAGKNSTKSWVYSVYNSKTGDVEDDKHNKLTNQDQSRHVDTIFKRRTTADIAIDCDISKITIKANGNVQTYDYAALKEGKIEGKDGWNADNDSGRNANLHSLEEKIQESLLNGKTGYQRAINESEYLYNASDYGLKDTRNLQVFVTYKVIVANVGSVNVRINEITDYYDSFYLQFFDSYENEQITRDNTDYDVLSPMKVSQTSEAHSPATNSEVGPADCNNMYKSLYLTDLNWDLEPTDYRQAEITFEQTKDEHGRIHLTQDLQNGTILRPDMNIFEINSYTTYGADGNGSETDEWRGLVTERSNVGDIESNDFYQNNQDKNDDSLYGHIKVFEDPVYNRIEYDTVQAPNVAIFVPKDGQKSTISGNTFEDIRDTDSKKDNKSTNAVIGNGVYDTNNKDVRDDNDKDKPIDGVTVQLVELIKWVDDKGYTESYKTKKYSSDYYIGEKIWDSTYYQLEKCDTYHAPNDNRRWQTSPIEYIPSENAEQNNVVQRYSSGSGKSRVILNVKPGVEGATQSYLETPESDIGIGEYKFENVPPGDFVVRFIYGDTTDTVLIKENNVTKLLGGELNAPGASVDAVGNTITDHESNPDNYGFLEGTGFIGTTGKNDKSYNGQDFKSTIYQTNYADPDKSFKDIKGPKSNNGYTIKSDDFKDYTNYVMQNYSNSNGIDMMYPIGNKTGEYNKEANSNDTAVKATLYYFDIEQSDDDHNKKDKLSDAKDIDSFRQNSNNYAKGYINDTEYGASVKAARLLRQNNSITGVADSSIENESKNTKDNKENAITLRNYRAEVLASWKEIGTYTFGTEYNSANRMQEQENPRFNENQSAMQKEMLIEFMKNTKMVAQTGVIRMQSEYNTTETETDFDTNMTMTNQGFIGTGKPEELKNYKGDGIDVKQDKYKREIVDNVDLGLVERPEAQLRLDKKVTNIKISLAQGETLFDTGKSVNNLYFGMHKGHKYYTIKNRLKSVSIGSNTKSTPELIQAYMDGELLKGANLDITYEFTIDNIGEVDYLDRQFYYVGTPYSTEEWNIARTNADEVLDYVSNNIRFDYNVNSTYDEVLIDSDKQQLKDSYSKLTWKVKGAAPSNASEILNSGNYSYYYIYPLGINSSDSGKLTTDVSNSVAIGGASNNKNDDLLNREYLPDVLSYNTLITTKGLSTTKYDPNKKNYESKQQVKFSDQYNASENESYSDGDTVYSYGLLPTTLDKNKKEDYMIKTQLVLSSTLSEDDQSLVYPNLTEIVRMSNSVGRRAFYSTVGNQPISNQNYGNDVPTREKDEPYRKYSKYNPVDVVTPIEIDADSSQSVRILPPTGFNKNNSNLYFAIIGASAIIIVSIFMIKTGFSARRKKKRTKDIRRWM